MLRALPAFTLSMFLAAAPAHARLKRTVNGYYTATAYSTPGETADGGGARRRKIAADPDLLPLGSRIRLSGAGSYSGEYIVGDTGPKIQGPQAGYFHSRRRSGEALRKAARARSRARAGARQKINAPTISPPTTRCCEAANQPNARQAVDS